MKNTADNKLPALKIWNRSIFLAGLSENFGKRNYPEEWAAAEEEAKSVGGFTGFLQSVKAEAKDGFPGYDAWSAASAQMTEKTKAMTALQKRCEREVHSHLLKGVFVGFGFDRPRQLDTEPVLIPARMWQGIIRYGANRLEYQSLSFSDIRVLSRDVLRRILEAENQLLPEQVSKQGRPGLGPHIEAAFHALSKAGEIDPGKSQRSHFPKVINWLQQNRPDLPVPPMSISDKTLAKFISPLFKQIRDEKNL